MEKTFKITNIFGGISPTYYFGPEGSYLNALGIDPDHPAGSGFYKNSGALVPTSYQKFSGTEFDGSPMWITSNPKSTNSYVYSSSGKFHSFDTNLAMRATEGAVNFPISIANASGNGQAYYDNYIYIFKDTDVDRYGPLNGTPALVAGVWTGATLGSKTALANTTYPIILGKKMPNHVAHVHGDNALYFTDVVNGKGVLHKIQTTKTTVEGDTNDNSAYNVVDLPVNMLPTCIESYGTDLVTGAIQTTDSTINQGKAMLYFWDTFDDSFYNEVPLPDAFVTAIKNINGILYIWSGNGNLGCRLSRYAGGDQLEQIAFIDDARPPYAGGVDGYGDKVIWGTHVQSPDSTGCVLSYGSKDSRLPQVVHNIMRVSDASESDMPTAVRIVQQASGTAPRFVVGWGNGTTYGLDKLGSSESVCKFLSTVFLTGGKFKIKKIKIPLGIPIDASSDMVGLIYVDSGSTAYTLPTINNTNFPSKYNLVFKEPDLVNVMGNNNFYLQLNWATASTRNIVTFPIEITVDVYEDE